MTSCRLRRTRVINSELSTPSDGLLRSSPGVSSVDTGRPEQPEADQNNEAPALFRKRVLPFAEMASGANCWKFTSWLQWGRDRSRNFRRQAYGRGDRETSM